MPFLIFAVVLAIMQTSAPVPRKAANHSAGTSQSVKQHSQTDQKPSAQPKPGLQPIGTPPYQANSNAVTTENAQQSIRVRELPPVSVTKDWMDRVYWIFSGILVVVGSLGVRAAYKTLKAIKEQTAEIGKSVEAIARQAGIMEKQTGILEESVAAARDNAAAASKNAEFSRLNAEATKDSAAAAKASAEALINIERAWVVAEMQNPPDYVRDRITRMVCRIWNRGNTPGVIAQMAERKHILPKNEVLPDEPDYGPLKNARTGPMPPKAWMPRAFWTTAAEQDSIESGDSILYFYGIVLYRDTLQPEKIRELRYCFKFDPGKDDRAMRNFYVEGPDAYNKAT